MKINPVLALFRLRRPNILPILIVCREVMDSNSTPVST